MTAKSVPSMPEKVADAFAAWPDGIAVRHREIRTLIYRTAAGDKTIGPLTETLKWGEPAYLTEATHSGSTVRLGVLSDLRDRPALLFNCRTVLLDAFRNRFPGSFETRGDRALLLPAEGPLPVPELSVCLHLALTYHRWRRAA